MDKGYQWAHKMVWCVSLYKKLARGIFSKIQENWNRGLSFACNIVENFFGWMLSLWNIISRKCTLSEKMYDTYVTICVCLTNGHIKLHPLRATDGQCYIQYLNRLNLIRNERKRKRAEIQALSWSRREQRLRAGHRQVNRNPQELGLCWNCGWWG